VFAINGDGNNSNISFDIRANPTGAYLQYVMATQYLQYVANGTALWVVDKNGNTNAIGTVSGGHFSTAGNIIAAGKIQSNFTFALTGPQGQNRLYFSQTNSVDRWAVGADATPETGGNTGSHFMVARFFDDGSYQGAALAISRLNGNATFSGTISTPDVYLGWANNTLQNIIGSLQANIGFTPVQQGGGLGGQTTDKIYLGYSPAGPRLTVNNTDFGLLAFAASNNIFTGNNNFTGNNSFGGVNTFGSNSLYITGTPAQDRVLAFRTGALNRFYIGLAPYAETGADVGSDFAINSCNDAGVYIGTPLKIIRKTAQVQFQTGFAAPWADLGNEGVRLFTNPINGGIRARFMLQNAEAAGNVGNDPAIDLFDNAGATLGPPPFWIKRSDKSVNIGNASELILTRGGGAGYSAPHAIKLLGGQPSIAFNENNLGTKAVIGAVAPGGIATLHFSPGNNTTLPFSFNIATGVGTCTTWTSTSDSRLKSNIVPITTGLDAIAALNAVTYLQATSEEDAAAGLGVFGAGVIAQDLIGTPFEGLVQLPSDNGFGGQTPYGFNYMGLTAFYIAAFKDARTRLNTQRTQLTNARNRINVLEGQLADVIARLTAAGI
jgi:hypothetical protein